MQLKNAAVALMLAGFGIAGFAAPGWAKAELQCNKKQTKCLTQSTQLTIGDRVGIFNGEGELVATGEVEAMRGERRAVTIDKRHGTIRKGYELALLKQGSSGSEDIGASYKVYQEPAKLTVGGSVGLSTWTIGEGSPGTEVSGYAQWRKWGGLQIIGRGVYTAVEGKVTRYGEDSGLESQPISIQGIGALGGVGYILRENQPLSFRGELGLGLMYVSAAIDGDSDLVDGNSGYNARVKNGAGAFGRASVGAIWNVTQTWHVHVDVAQALVHEAMGSTIAGGVSTDLH